MSLYKLKAGQHGVALIQVLLLTAILSIMALQFTLSSRHQVKIATDMSDKVSAKVRLRTIESQLLYELLTSSRNDVNQDVATEGSFAQFWNFYGEPFKLSEGVTVSIQDINGLLSLYGQNNSNELNQFLIFLGVSPQAAKTIISNVKYWQGLGRDQYTSMRNHEIRANQLLSVSELNNIEGIDRQLYENLSPVVTTLQNIVFNPFTAPLRVLQAQLSPEVYIEVVRLRKEGTLTRKRFSELTKIYESDTVAFMPGRRLKIAISVTVGLSTTKKEFICYLRPENALPVVWFQ